MSNKTDKNIELLKYVDLCCPKCKSELDQKAESFNCVNCKKHFPVMHGIPDFRLFGDPYLGFDNDYSRTKLVAENMDRFDLEGLLKFYWSNSPETPYDLRKKFVRAAMLGEAKAKEILRVLPLSENSSTQKFLEIGCGTGGLLVAASRKYGQIIGTDIALRWLTVCRKRLEEAKVDIPLVCCCAEHLPFKDKFVDQIAACATVEHTRNQVDVISESYRVLKNGGDIFISTPNRFSISVEPHVYLWGVGFLPRKWMGFYVKLMKGVEYKNKRLLSYFNLKAMLSKFKCVEFSFPDVDDSSIGQFTSFERLQVSVYKKMRRLTLFKLFLLLLGPMYYIAGKK